MFHDVDSALRWAARIKCTLIIDGSSINDMCGKPRHSTTNELLMGLSPQEAQQQADNIIKYASCLSDPVCSQYVHAKYLFLSSVDDLVNRVLSNITHATTGTNRRNISLVVQSYFGNKATRRELRESLRCRNSDVKRLQDGVYTAMDKVHYRAMCELEEKLIDVGLMKTT